MSAIVQTYLANRIVCHPASPGDTNWHYVGIDPSTRGMTFYDSLEALKAAGDLTYPGLDGGGKIGGCLMATKTSAGAAGSDVEFAVNTSTLPTGVATATNVVAGAGQQISEFCPFRNLAIKLIASSDLLILDGAH